MRRLGLCLALATAITAPAFGADDHILPNLSDQMKLPAYHQTVDGLFDKASPPDWFKDYLASGNTGTVTPGKTVIVEDRHHKQTTYELYGVCKADRCQGNAVYLLFEPGGGNAWGLSTRGGGHTRWYNNPDMAQRRALQHAANYLK